MIGIAYSAGGLSACKDLLRVLPDGFGVPILVVQHLSATYPSRLPEVLGWSSQLPVRWASHGDRPLAGQIYVAPPDHHLVVTENGELCLSSAPKINYFRPAADVLFASMAKVFAERAVSVVLSGFLGDGATGTAAVRAAGGLTLAQNEETSAVFEMPAAAIDYGKAEMVFPPARIGLALTVAGAEGRG